MANHAWSAASVDNIYLAATTVLLHPRALLIKPNSIVVSIHLCRLSALTHQTDAESGIALNDLIGAR
jgi:hypothetical protein